jgi:hypothetical protein
MLLVAAGLLAVPRTARAEGGPLGIGLVLGEPSGVTGMLRFRHDVALDVAVGIDVFDEDGFYVHGVVDYFFPRFVENRAISLRPYLGAGAFLADVHDDLGFGGRAPLGLSLDLAAAPFQIYAELVLDLLILPDIDLDLGVAVGFRYYF